MTPGDVRVWNLNPQRPAVSFCWTARLWPSRPCCTRPRGSARQLVDRQRQRRHAEALRRPTVSIVIRPSAGFRLVFHTLRQERRAQQCQRLRVLKIERITGFRCCPQDGRAAAARGGLEEAIGDRAQKHGTHPMLPMRRHRDQLRFLFNGRLGNLVSRPARTHLGGDPIALGPQGLRHRLQDAFDRRRHLVGGTSLAPGGRSSTWSRWRWRSAGPSAFKARTRACSASADWSNGTTTVWRERHP